MQGVSSVSVMTRTPLSLQHPKFRPPLDLEPVLPPTPNPSNALDAPNQAPHLLMTVPRCGEELLKIRRHDTVDPRLPCVLGVQQRYVLVLAVLPDGL